jgi:aspartyl-tRNA(Asn)/glutamyl-tRNA(Gln) amidotransferase subunit A
MSDAPHLRPLDEIARGNVSAVAVARACMTAVVNGESGPGRLNAFISYDYEAALAQAERVDADRKAGRWLRLAGVPVAVKDNICTLGLPTTCASRILARYRSPYEATVVRRLRDTGAVIVGKTNLDEFAMGSSTETSAFGPARNPHDSARVPGGSSGGSAAAVAAGMVPVALGSDTGGSVRQPAAFCGVVGIRPTWGRVSRYGLVAFASSLDQVGVLGRNVADAALMLDVISGADPLDPTCAAVRAGAAGDVGADVHADARGDSGVHTHAPAESAARLVIGVPREYFPDDLDPGVRRACERALDALRSAGCTIRDVSLPHTRYGVPSYSVLAAAEASTNLARFDGVRFGTRARAGELYEATRTAGFGAEVKRRIMLGTFVLSAGHHDQHHASAQRVRSLIARDFARVFAEGVDVLFTPTTPAPAFPVGGSREPYEMYAADVYTAPASLAGVPAMSVPIGTTDGLPVGGQIIAPQWCEDTMIAAAALVERGLTG